MSIQETYSRLCQTPSDINEHLPTLYKYSLLCDHITEMGVRDGVSTWAFLAARPKRLISYDFCFYEGVNKVIEVAMEETTEFHFIKVDVLDVDIEQTDLLFIDTFHHPLQLRREFARHSSKVNKYIILHDTESHKRVNEILWPDEIDAMKKSGKNVDEYNNYPNTGIFSSIVDFLWQNRGWSIREVYSNNNGLTILEKDALE